MAYSGCEYYNKKLDDIRVIDWQFFMNDTWKSFDKQGNGTEGDNVMLESAFQHGSKTCDLNHGWSKTFTINFENKTSKNTRSSKTQNIRRWCSKTLKQLHKDEVDKKRSDFLRKNKRSAEKLWKKFFKGSKFDFRAFFSDCLDVTSRHDINVLIWFWKTESIPGKMDQDAFYLGLAQCNNATSARKIASAVAADKKKLINNAATWKEFYEWVFCFVANGMDKRAIPIKETGKRIDPADGAAYLKSDVMEYYGAEEGEANWAKFGKEKRAEIIMWELLLKFKGLDKLNLQPGTGMPGAVEAWSQFLVTRPESIFGDSYETIGVDEWWCIFEYISNLEPKWAGFDECDAPSLVSEFRSWAQETFTSEVVVVEDPDANSW